MRRARRAALLAAARALLAERPLEAVTLPMIAEAAGIPVSSSYHFFRDVGAVWIDLARALSVEMAALGADGPPTARWQDAVQAMLAAQASFFNAEPAARALMLGGSTTLAIKRAACHEDDRFGHALAAAIGRDFALPAGLADDLFFKAIQIADVFYALAAAAHDRVTREAEDEANDAVVAYLRLYLPVTLPRAGHAAHRG